MRGQEGIGVVAVDDRGDVQARVGYRRRDRAQRRQRRNAPDDVSGEGLSELLAAEVGVAEVIDGGEQQRHARARAPTATFPRRLASARVPLNIAKTARIGNTDRIRPSASP